MDADTQVLPTQPFLLAALRAEVSKVRERGGGNPRVHPNGFIQLDLEDVADSWNASHKRGHSGANRRMHIWNPPGIILPHQGTVNEIHDHVFDMESTVVKGVLEQRLYTMTIGGFTAPDHELYRAVYSGKSDSRLESTGVKGYLVHRESYPIKAGETYTQRAFTFHDSFAEGLVVTIMTKKHIHDGDASVIVPVGTVPDNSYDRAGAMPTEDIWNAIFRSLAS